MLIMVLTHTYIYIAFAEMAIQVCEGQIMARSRTKISGAMIGDASITSDDLGASVARGGDVDFMALKIGIQNNLTIYNLKDGIVDRYADATGVDASASTNETRDSSGKYYVGQTTVTAGFRESITSTPGSGTWIAPAGATSVEVLVVGGGGGSGSAYGSSGGGGAGGVVYHASKSVTASSSYTVTIGAGGTCTASGRGTNGTNSVFSDITALGGGGGGGRNAPQPGLSGGSGGGGGSDGGGGTVYPGGSGTQADSGGGTGYGNAGGSGSHVSGTWEGGGGGGGAGAAGGNAHRAQPSSGYGVAGGRWCR